MSSKQPFAQRRSFLRRLMGRKRVNTSLFALQVVLEVGPTSPLRKRIQACLDAPAEESPGEKQRFYKTLTSVLREGEPFYEFAFFEYVIDADDAVSAFREWVTEIQAGMATEEGEMGDDVDGYLRMGSEQQYVVVSILLLIDGPYPLHGDARDEDEIYSRPGIGKLIDSINHVDFHRLEADAVFLVPGNDQDGLSWSDFADEGWSYLKPLRSDEG